MKALEERAEVLARHAQRRRVEEVAEQWRSVPGVSVTATDSEVAIEARGLSQHWLVEPMLRFAGRLGR